MARKVDITEKLSFDENPRIKVKEKEYEVNADAATVLELMGVLGDKETPGPKEVVEMYELLFSEGTREEIKKLNMSFGDLQVFIGAAITLVTGGTAPGEQ